MFEDIEEFDEFLGIQSFEDMFADDDLYW